MKNIIYLLITSSLFFSSCIVDKFEKPRKTKYARNIAYVSSNSFIKDAVLSLYIADKVNMWLTAETIEKKNEIEDKYFPEHKIRFNNNIITIKNLCVINTFGKSINEIQSSWTINHYENEMITSEPTKITFLSNNSYEIENKNLLTTIRSMSYTQTTSEYRLTLTIDNNMYVLTNGISKQKIDNYGESVCTFQKSITVANLKENYIYHLANDNIEESLYGRYNIKHNNTTTDIFDISVDYSSPNITITCNGIEDKYYSLYSYLLVSGK